jgi:hypothetical protein
MKKSLPRTRTRGTSNLRTDILLVLCFVFLSFAVTCFGQNQCSAINQSKEHTYGFHPPALSKAERDLKSKEMDEFWKAVQSSGPAGVECVRQLMAKEATDTYFLFDGASLLANLDKSHGSDRAILDGLERAEMKDVTPDGYVALCLQLSKRNVDIESAARKYLYAPDVTAYLPRHGGYKLDRPQGAILLYGSLEPSLVDHYLIPELSSPNSEVRNTAAFILSMNMTEASFRALSSLTAMPTFSKETREGVAFVRSKRSIPVTKPAKYTRQQMLEKLERLPEIDPNMDETEDKALDNSIYATLTTSDLDALREGRRKMIQGVSNESVEGYEEMSRVLLNLINVLDAYSEYRTH